MDRKIAILATLVVVVGLGFGSWLALKPRGDDLFADCREGTVAGGTAAIGGPFELTDQTGARVTDADVIDGLTLIYFGYTHCPDICPMDNARNAEAVDLLAQREIDVTPVFVTVDPERDTPEIMADYAEWMHDDMIGLTGSPEDISAASLAYKVYAAKSGQGPDYLMDHTTYTYLMAPEHGFLEYFNRDVTPEQMADRVACFAERL